MQADALHPSQEFSLVTCLGQPPVVPHIQPEVPIKADRLMVQMNTQDSPHRNSFGEEPRM